MKDQDAVIIGAGQAGLGVSYFLQQSGLTHTVFERGRIGESWLSQRWDSFKLNTPNIFNTLPGLPYEGEEPDGFWSSAEFVQYLQKYAKHFNLPVQTGITVTSVEQSTDGQKFIIKTKSNDQAEETITCRSVVIASGIQRKPVIPSIHSNLPDSITQLHVAEYCNPQDLPPGAVVIVGSGQSGCQICEDLLDAGRTVYLCTSKVARTPRRYRGKDIVQWMKDFGLWDITYDRLEDKAESRATQPQISGLGRYGHTISLQYLAQKGAIILGRLKDVDCDILDVDDQAAAHIIFADQFSQKLKTDIDSVLSQKGSTLPAAEDDPADRPDTEASCASDIRRLNLHEAEVNTIIWATGFKGDFSWIRLPVLDSQNEPIHKRGISPVRGLYFVGFPWLNSRKSGIILGIEEDARYVVDAITEQLN